MAHRFRNQSAGLVAAAAMLAFTLPMAPAAAQMNDKWVTLVMQAAPETADPCMSSRSATGSVIMQNVVEPLILINPENGELEPSLATSWEQVNDSTWRFKLREGVSFHDGEPFNAEAAVKVFERSSNRDLSCNNWITAFSNINIIAKAIDEYTLELTSDQPEPIMPVRVTAITMHSPNTPMDKVIFDPKGTGPYILEKFVAGEEILLKRNENYWGDKPEVEGARYVFRSESAVRAAMVKQGEADIAPNIQHFDANDAELDIAYPTGNVTYLRLDNLTPPLNDVRVRLALNYAFDRQSILESVMSEGTEHATQLVLPIIPGHNPELDEMVRPYDPEKAKQLIAEAKADGVPVDTEIVILSRPNVFPGAGEIAELAFEMFRSVGLNVKLQTIEEGQVKSFNDQPFAEGRPPMMLMSAHDNLKGDPVFSLGFKYSCEGRQSQVCIPELDKKFADAAATPVGPERVKKYQALFKEIYEEVVPDVWLYATVGHARVNPRVTFKPDITSGSRVPLARISFN